MNTIRESGWIEVVTGSMFSGKSEELIRRVKRARLGRKKTIVFKPEVDDRYCFNSVVSHNGDQVNAINITKSREILSYMTEDIDVVAIDEIQFLDDKLVDVCNDLATMGKRVIVAGLDTDFRGQPFGCTHTLMAVAEYVDKLQAICVVCGNPANRTQRLIEGKPAVETDPIILIGAVESYEARCRKCHVVPK